MKFIIGGGLVAFATCLSASAWSQQAVNDETSPLAFILREAEIKAGAAAEAPDAAAAPAQEITEPATPTRSAATRRPLAAPAGSGGLKALVARHAAAQGVPFSLADAVVRIESRYNPRAANRGNYGLMQIRHQTARGMGYSGGAAGLLDAETNVRYAMKYLAQAHRLAGGDTCRTVMKYQSGHMAQRMSAANRAYCAKVRTITASN